MSDTKSAEEILTAAKKARDDAQKELDKRTEIYNALLVYAGVAEPETDSCPAEIDVSKLPLTEAQSRGLILDNIREVISRFKDEQEFMVVHVESALEQIGKPLEGKNPRGRISSALKNLEKQCFIRCVFTGGGNVPNRYVKRPELLVGPVDNPTRVRDIVTPLLEESEEGEAIE